MKITKYLAQQITKELLKAKHEQYQKDKQSVTIELQEFFNNNLPLEIQKLKDNSKFSKYLVQTSYSHFYINIGSGKICGLHIQFKTPVIGLTSYYRDDQLPTELRDKMCELYKTERKLSALEYSLKDSIYNLGNTTRLKTDFAEAYAVYKKLDKKSEEFVTEVKKVNESLEKLKQELI
jgi:hypothetical protein